jgi:hypothetical protein
VRSCALQRGTSSAQSFDGPVRDDPGQRLTDDAASDLAGVHVRRRVTGLLAAGCRLVVGCVGGMDAGAQQLTSGVSYPYRPLRGCDWWLAEV